MKSYLRPFPGPPTCTHTYQQTHRQRRVRGRCKGTASATATADCSVGLQLPLLLAATTYFSLACLCVGSSMHLLDLTLLSYIHVAIASYGHQSVYRHLASVHRYRPHLAIVSHRLTIRTPYIITLILSTCSYRTYKSRLVSNYRSLAVD